MVRVFSLFCLIWLAVPAQVSWAGPLLDDAEKNSQPSGIVETVMPKFNRGNTQPEEFPEHGGEAINAIVKKSPEAFKGGPYKNYYEDGTIKTEGFYKNGQLDGLQKNYDESGILRQEITFVNGIEEGPQTSYDEQGRMESQWTVHNGKRDGVYRSFFHDGTIAETRNYTAGVLLDDNGKPYNGPYTVNYADGKPYKKFSYKNGLAEGLFQIYSPEGTLEAEYTYVNDKMNGPFKAYRNGGYFESTLVDDVEQGVRKIYDDHGRLRATQIIKDGQPVEDMVYFDKNGKAYPKPVILNEKLNRVIFFGLWFVIFLFSLVFHEAGHAWAALKLGDETAYKGGQVSISPLPHIRREPVGMIVLPILTYWSQGWMIGWASAPYNPQWALAHPRRAALMSLAGPAANLLLIVLAGLAMRIGASAGIFAFAEDISATAIVGGVSMGWTTIAAAFCSILFFLNIILFSFNLLPLPPLDGSGAVPLILPHGLAEKYMGLINHPAAMVVGLITAWTVFGAIAGLIFEIFLSILALGF